MSRPHFGIGMQGDRDLSEYGPLGRLAEDLGFDVVTAFGDAGYLPPLAVLLQVAAATTRVRLGPSCLNPYTSHPVEIAGQIAALEAASGGRAYLGLARGAWLDTIGVKQQRPLRALREAATVVEKLLRGDDSGFAGEMFSIEPGFRLDQPLPGRKVRLRRHGVGQPPQEPQQDQQQDGRTDRNMQRHRRTRHHAAVGAGHQPAERQLDRQQCRDQPVKQLGGCAITELRGRHPPLP